MGKMSHFSTSYFWQIFSLSKFKSTNCLKNLLFISHGSFWAGLPNLFHSSQKARHDWFYEHSSWNLNIFQEDSIALKYSTFKVCDWSSKLISLAVIQVRFSSQNSTMGIKIGHFYQKLSAKWTTWRSPKFYSYSTFHQKDTY